MKNEIEIAAEIKQLEKDYSPQFVDKRIKKKAEKRAMFLRKSLQIIAVCPNETMLKEQLNKATTTLQNYQRAYHSVPDWCITADLKKQYRSSIKQKYEPVKCKVQVEAIKFVLEV